MIELKRSSVALCIVIGLAASAPACAPPVEVDQNTRLAEFEQTLERLAVDLHLPGMAAGIIRDQELWWFRGFGYADLENGTPVTPDTPYHLASLTKTFASTILMQLVEQGRLDLDAPVSEFGIDLESPGTISVRHIFSHTSHGNPGEAYSYNGSLFGGGLGKVIQDTTGRSFEAELTAKIVEPLGLENTGRQTEDLKTPVAQPYVLDDAGELELSAYPTTFSPSAGMVSSIADYAAYDAAIDRHRFLRPETQAEAFSPMVSTLGHELPYGLGWFTQEFAGVRMIWHYGHWTCTSTLVLKIPEKNITFLAFTNTDHLSRGFGLGDGDVLDSPLAIAFLKAFVLDDAVKRPSSAIDWRGGTDTVHADLEAIQDRDLRTLLEREYWANVLIAAIMGDREDYGRLIRVYGTVFPSDLLAELNELPEIARIDRVGTNKDESREFTLTEETRVRVVCAAEQAENRLHDFGWIEDRSGAAKVWEMSPGDNDHGGGHSDNRIANVTLTLPAGEYVLRFKTDDAHDFENWNRRPPDGGFWGIRLYRL